MRLAKGLRRQTVQASIEDLLEAIDHILSLNPAAISHQFTG